MIRIASLVPYKVMPAEMGGQKAVYYQLKHLSDHFPVTCYTTKNNEPDPETPFKVKSLFSNSRLRYINLFYFFILRREMKKGEITHLLIEHPYFGWLGILLRRFSGIKLVVRSHNIEALRFKSTGKWWWPILFQYEKITHRHADLSLFITEEDRQYAIRHYRVNPDKTTVITYGTERENAPSLNQKSETKKKICTEYQLPADSTILLFNGNLDYPPNRWAVEEIINRINPLLSESLQKPYALFICGRSRDENFIKILSSLRQRHICFTGFVKDIQEYFMAADIFLNPVIEGGGIKTKLVEALAHDTVSVSYESGARGLPLSATGSLLHITPDRDPAKFAQAVLEEMNKTTRGHIPPVFFKYFNQRKIAEKVSSILSAQSTL